MFSSRKDFSLTLGMLLSTSLLVYACGGGGGGGASTTPATSKASSAATKSLVSTVGAVGAGTDAGAAKPSFKGTASGTENDAKLIRKGIENLKARMQGGGNRQKAMMAVTDSGEVSCGPLGGTERNIIDDSGTPSDTSDDKFTTIYTDCRTDEGNGIHKLKNGTVEESFAGGLFSSSFSNSDTTRGFEESEIDTTGGTDRVIKFESTKGTLEMTGGSFSSDCPDKFFAQNAALTMNMTVEEKEDDDATVGFEKHEIFTANNFTMKITDNFNAADCTFTGEVIVLNGTTSFEDKLNPASDDNYSASFTNFTVTLSEREDASGAFLGEEIALSGSVTITSSCANGTYTVETTTPLFFPDGAACPVEGRIDVSGGGSTSAVVVNSDGSVDFDDNGDGNVDDDNDGVIEPGEGKHFDSCDDADICDV